VIVTGCTDPLACRIPGQFKILDNIRTTTENTDDHRSVSNVSVVITNQVDNETGVLFLVGWFSLKLNLDYNLDQSTKRH